MKRYVTDVKSIVLTLAFVMICFGVVGCPAATNTGDRNTIDTSGASSAANLVVFQDPDTSFSSSDVYDVDDEIVRFDSNTNSIIWAASDTSFQMGSWVTSGNFLGATNFFQVRFGNVDGQRRAFFTETVNATICDIGIIAGSLSISGTNVTVPQ